MKLTPKKLLITKEEFKLILRSKEYQLHNFLPDLLISIETYPNNIPLQKLTLLKTYKTHKSKSKYFTDRIYDEITIEKKGFFKKLLSSKVY